MVVVDEKGHVVDGDQILAVIAESWKADGRLAKPAIVATVMSNLGLERHLAGIGLGFERTAVGDRYVLERMVEKGINVGGEQSGHLILTDYSTTGDGLVAAMQVIAMVKKLDRPASEDAGASSRCRKCCATWLQGRTSAGDESVVKAIAATTARLGASGRLVIRPSGTEPVIGLWPRPTTRPWWTRWWPTSATRWRRRRREGRVPTGADR